MPLSRVLGPVALLTVLAGRTALAQGDVTAAQSIEAYRTALLRCATTGRSLVPAEVAGCVNLRARMARAVAACGTVERDRDLAVERYGSYDEVKEVCDLLVGRIEGSLADPGLEEAVRRERQRLQDARNDCQHQWGNLASMVEHCEKQAREAGEEGGSH